VVKYRSSTVGVPLILRGLSGVGVAGIYGVAVKCIDTVKNTDSEGRPLGPN
jgi:hypothetical protein